jgi:hypothetical protein
VDARLDSPRNESDLRLTIYACSGVGCGIAVFGSVWYFALKKRQRRIPKHLTIKRAVSAGLFRKSLRGSSFFGQRSVVSRVSHGSDGHATLNPAFGAVSVPKESKECKQFPQETWRTIGSPRPAWLTQNSIYNRPRAPAVGYVVTRSLHPMKYERGVTSRRYPLRQLDIMRQHSSCVPSSRVLVNPLLITHRHAMGSYRRRKSNMRAKSDVMYLPPVVVESTNPVYM